MVLFNLKIHENVNIENSLTPRMLEYLTLAGFGLSNKEIAGLLCVSLSTVKKTLEDIFAKLNALDRANAVLIACIHELITVDRCNNVLDKYPNAKSLIQSKIIKRL